jgi:hypothetical protein
MAGNITTQPKQGRQAMSMSNLCILLRLWAVDTKYKQTLRAKCGWKLVVNADKLSFDLVGCIQFVGKCWCNFEKTLTGKHVLLLRHLGPML